MSISQKQTYISSNTTWRIHLYFTKTDLHIIKYHLENPCLFHENRPVTYHQIPPRESMSISQKQNYISSNTTWRIHVYFAKTEPHIIKYHLENPCLFRKNRTTYHQIPPGESMSISQKQTYISSNTTWRIHLYFTKTDLHIIKYHLENPCLFHENRPVTYHQIPPRESMSISQKQNYISSNTTWRIHVYFAKTDLHIIKYHLENPCLFLKKQTFMLPISFIQFQKKARLYGNIFHIKESFQIYLRNLFIIPPTTYLQVFLKSRLNYLAIFMYHGCRHLPKEVDYVKGLIHIFLEK